jgi:hypothetical protein
VAVSLDQPAFVVGLPELDQREAEFLDRPEGPDPEQVLLQRPDEPLGAAVALGGADEGGRNSKGVNMKKYLIAAASAGVLLATMNAPAHAAWQLIKIAEYEDTIFRSVTAGKSGVVKECYESNVTVTTFQWTHSQTGNTRGTVDETTVTDETLVANSFCY